MSDREIIEDQAEIYRASFARHGDAPRATYNAGREAQELRFERLMRHLTPSRSPFSIHDVGAGLCDLHRYLLDEGIDHVYSGTDVVQEMIDHAREKYPEITLHNRDILADEVAERHDFVVLSGLFNLPGKTPPDAWNRFVLQMVERMYEMADVAVSFNFLSAYRTFTDPDLFYIDPAEMLDHCMKQLSRFVILDHAYPLFECTATVFRPEFVERQFEAGSFAKYFGVRRFEQR
jgi:hypothetical protein